LVLTTTEYVQIISIFCFVNGKPNSLPAHCHVVHLGQAHVEVTPLVQFDVVRFDRIQIFQTIEPAAHQNEFGSLLAEEE